MVDSNSANGTSDGTARTTRSVRDERLDRLATKAIATVASLALAWAGWAGNGLVSEIKTQGARLESFDRRISVLEADRLSDRLRSEEVSTAESRARLSAVLDQVRTLEQRLGTIEARAPK